MHANFRWHKFFSTVQHYHHFKKGSTVLQNSHNSPILSYPLLPLCLQDQDTALENFLIVSPLYQKAERTQGNYSGPERRNSKFLSGWRWGRIVENDCPRKNIVQTPQLVLRVNTFLPRAIALWNAIHVPANVQQTSSIYTQDPLEAILVLFGRSSALAKIWKRTPLSTVRMRSGDHRRDAKGVEQGTSLCLKNHH